MSPGWSPPSLRSIFRQRLPLLPQHWSVRRRVLLLFGVFLVPILGLAYLLVSVSISEIEASTSGSSLAAAQNGAGRVSDSIEATERLLGTLALQPTIVNQDGEAAVSLLVQAVMAQPGILNIVVADGAGKVFSSTVRDGKGPQDVLDQQYFRLAMLSGLPTVSQTRLSARDGGLPTIVVAAPVKGELGARIGMVAAELSLDFFQAVVGDVDGLQRGAAMLVDAEGTVLTYPDWRRVSDGIEFPYSPTVQGALRAAVQAAQRGGRGTFELDNRQNGERALIAYVPVPGTSWTLTHVRLMSDVDSTVWALMLPRLLLLFGGICAMTLLAIVMLRWVNKPIDTLRSKAQAALTWTQRPMGNAAPAGEPHDRDGDDIQQVTEVFDSLAAVLEARAAELAELKHEVDRRNLQLKRLSVNMAAAEDEQRVKIARDVHDGVAQFLAMASLEAQEAEQYLTLDVDRAAEKIRSTLQFVREADREVRRDLLELHPPRIGREEFSAWLQDYVDHYGMACALRCELSIIGTPARVERAVSLVLYRAVQESFHNIRRHAQASRIDVHLVFQPTTVKLVVKDDGRGFSPEIVLSDPPVGHLGLLGMRERAQAVGGVLAIDSAAGRGTSLMLEVPYSRSQRRSCSRRSHDLNVSHAFTT